MEAWIGELACGEKSAHEMLGTLPIDSIGGGMDGSCLLSRVCSMNHSCIPNVMVAFDTVPAQEAVTATVFALRDIEEGEELFISYIDTAMGLEERQSELLGYQFECGCPKCRLQSATGEFDPAEPGWAEAVRGYAKAANDEDRDGDAREGLELLWEHEECSVDDAVALGTALMNQGRWKDGYELVECAMSKFGEDPKLVERLAVQQFATCEDGADWGGECEIRLTSGGQHIALAATPVISKEDCAWVVRQAEAAAEERGGWGTQRHYSVPTTDLALHSIPEVRAWFNELIQSDLFPMICKQYHRPHPCALRVHDVFIVKYDAAQGQRSLPVHVDQSSYSFTIALNGVSEYEGGGTWFEDLKQSIRVDCGQVLAFPGDLLHGGAELTSGVRYIIAAFLYYDEALCNFDDEPEV